MDFAYGYGPGKDFVCRSAMTLTFVQDHCTLSTKRHSMGEVRARLVKGRENMLQSGVGWMK